MVSCKVGVLLLLLGINFDVLLPLAVIILIWGTTWGSSSCARRAEVAHLHLSFLAVVCVLLSFVPALAFIIDGCDLRTMLPTRGQGDGSTWAADTGLQSQRSRLLDRRSLAKYPEEGESEPLRPAPLHSLPPQAGKTRAQVALKRQKAHGHFELRASLGRERV